MSGSTAPQPPSGLSVAISPDQTSATVTFTPSTSTPVATSFLVQWGLQGNDPLTTSNPGQWLGSQVVTTGTVTIPGLTPGSTYDVQITAQAVGQNGTLSSSPVTISADMQPEDTEQDSFFSVYVPATAGTSYIRVGPADMSTVETGLLTDWANQSGDNNPVQPATLDLGLSATTGIMLYSDQDIALLGAQDIRVRATNNYYLSVGNAGITTMGGTASVVDNNGNMWTFQNQYQVNNSGPWWNVTYDRTYNLGFTETTGGSYSLGATYNFMTGGAFSNQFAVSCNSSVNALATQVNFSLFEVDIGWMSLDTKVLGNAYSLRSTVEFEAKVVKLTLSKEEDSPAEIAITVFAVILLALSAVVTAFGIAVNIAEWVYLQTANGVNPQNITNFLTNTAIPFYLTSQATSALVLLGATALGAAQILSKKVSAQTDQAYFHMDHKGTGPTKARIYMENSEAVMLAEEESLKIGWQEDLGGAATSTLTANTNPISGLFTDATQTTLTFALTADTTKPTMKMSTTGIDLTVLGTGKVTVNSLAGITFVCGASKIEMEDAAIKITTAALTSNNVQFKMQ